MRVILELRSVIRHVLLSLLLPNPKPNSQLKTPQNSFSQTLHQSNCNFVCMSFLKWGEYLIYLDPKSQSLNLQFKFPTVASIKLKFRMWVMSFTLTLQPLPPTTPNSPPLPTSQTQPLQRPLFSKPHTLYLLPNQLYDQSSWNFICKHFLKGWTIWFTPTPPWQSPPPPPFHPNDPFNTPAFIPPYTPILPYIPKTSPPSPSILPPNHPQFLVLFG